MNGYRCASVPMTVRLLLQRKGDQGGSRTVKAA